MAKNNKSAIEWLIENIPQRFANAFKNECQDLILEAKQKEKEEIQDAWMDGNAYHASPVQKAEQYYNETYGEINQPPTQS